jgi:MSHA biogenesis protein MshO
VLTSAKQFPLSSPHQRFYVVDTPITYRCDANRLMRYSGYAISSTAADPPSGVTGQLLVNQVSDCQFVYTEGTSTNSGLLTLQLTLTDDAGESAQLLHQVHVDNAP